MRGWDDYVIAVVEVFASAPHVPSRLRLRPTEPTTASYGLQAL